MSRPAIPTETRREVLFEARHRCAVCCWQLPLEMAHIVPWHQTHDHSVDNLIALCPNCHAQADKEHWGADQLRRYKDRPCALERNVLPPMSATQRAIVDLIVQADPENISMKERKAIVRIVAAFLQLDAGSVKSLAITEDNSSRITLVLPIAFAREFLATFSSPVLEKELAPYGLKTVRESDPSRSVLRSDGAIRGYEFRYFDGGDCYVTYGLSSRRQMSGLVSFNLFDQIPKKKRPVEAIRFLIMSQGHMIHRTRAVRLNLARRTHKVFSFFIPERSYRKADAVEVLFERAPQTSIGD